MDLRDPNNSLIFFCMSNCRISPYAITNVFSDANRTNTEMRRDFQDKDH